MILDYLRFSFNLYNLIKKADKIVAFHGMMTNLASLEKKPVLDLFHCDIKSLEDYRRYKNEQYNYRRYKNEHKKFL